MSDLKEKLEKIGIKKKDATIISLDIEAMYPSIKYGVVKKAVNYFSKNLSTDERATIKDCLKMIKFGMGNTLISFKDKYFEYGGSVNPMERGLRIGGYDSAWLADLVAAWILEKSKDIFEKNLPFQRNLKRRWDRGSERGMEK